MKTVNDIDFTNKKVLVRVDFNVPLNENLEVTDTTRIEAAKPTVISILESGGSCILLSHLGRPKNKEDEFSLRHIVNSVTEIYGITVKFANDCIGPVAEEAVKNLQPGEILLLEKLRNQGFSYE